jgi:hypothetical protein
VFGVAFLTRQMSQADRNVMLNKARHLFGVRQLVRGSWSLRARAASDAVDRGASPARRRSRTNCPRRALEAEVRPSFSATHR